MSSSNGEKRKVCVVVTARPSYSRIKTALVALRERDDVELQVVVAASALLDRYGQAVRTIEDDGFEIAARVFSVVEGENLTTMAKSTGLGLLELPTVFDQLNPDVVVTIADRHETIATAIAASYMNLPVAHVQGGEVTGSIDEKVRHAVTKLADLHLVSTEKAKERVIRMGEEPSRVVVTGCPSIDIAAEVAKSPALDFDPIDRYGGVGGRVDTTEPYLVVMHHPVTTEVDSARRDAEEVLEAVAAAGLQTFWFWPNVDAGSDGTSNAIRAFRERTSLGSHPEKHSAPMRFFKNMQPADFLRLIGNSACLVGNSSVGIRESSYLGVPVVNIGSRQQDRERGPNVLDVENDRNAIRHAIERQTGQGPFPSAAIYGDGSAGPRIAEALATADLVTTKRLTY